MPPGKSAQNYFEKIVLPTGDDAFDRFSSGQKRRRRLGRRQTHILRRCSRLVGH
jgi:hypothetical protein